MGQILLAAAIGCLIGVVLGFGYMVWSTFKDGL